LFSTLVRTAVVAAVAVAGLSAGTAAADTARHTLNVVALGDSYGSGTGAGDYLDGTGVANGCWRSANSYSETLVARLRDAGASVSFTNVTCSGASTATLREEFKGEAPQLDALQPDTHVVFLSIGTGDIDFAGYGAQCVLADCSGQPTQDELAKLPGMSQNLATLLADIRTRSPHAHVVLTGYGSQLTDGPNAPDVPLDPICGDGIFTPQERIDGNQVAAALDQTLRGTARQAGATFVTPYGTPEFAGHSLCQADVPYYRGFEALAPGQEGLEAVLHLNATGQRTLADLIQHRFHLS